MNRTDRLLAILLELQRKGSRRAEDLAATFETSKRTIYRDIQALCEAGVPIVSLPGQGYALLEGYFLPPLSFTTDEAIMLLLGSDFVARNMDSQYQDAARSAGRKIEAVLSEKLRVEVQYLKNSISFFSGPTLPADAEKLQQLRRAIIARKTARFSYHTRYGDDGRSARRVREADPYGLGYYFGAWYLVAYCHTRRQTRTFRLDRMTNLTLLEKTFQQPAGFKMEKQEVDDQRNLVVRALFDKEIAPWVRESRSFYVVDMQDGPDGLLVTLRVRVEDEIMQWLLSWGGRVRVFEPDSLRKRLAEEGQKMLENHSRLAQKTAV